MAKEYTELTSQIEYLARDLNKSGLKTLDALHLAFASSSNIDYFCTCDDKLLKKARSLNEVCINIVSPTDLVMGL